MPFTICRNAEVFKFYGTLKCGWNGLRNKDACFPPINSHVTVFQSCLCLGWREGGGWWWSLYFNPVLRYGILLKKIVFLKKIVLKKIVFLKKNVFLGRREGGGRRRRWRRCQQGHGRRGSGREVRAALYAGGRQQEGRRHVLQEQGRWVVRK